MKLPRALLLAGLLGAVSAGALAQWQWIERDGRKVFSDQSPPPDIPEQNILRRPGQAVARAAPPVAPAASAPASATLKPVARDTALEEKKKQAEAAETARLKAEEEKFQKARAENCARARKAKATLDSGARVASLNDQGERIIMDDTTRAAESRRIQDVINAECK
jgi:type IV secretory pathway VirB10-like protein